MGFVDLHVHTKASDGSRTPSEVVFEARDAGLKAIGIADHDTVAGVDEAITAGTEAGVEIVPAVEINTDHDGLEVHVLGYYPDRADPAFADLLSKLSGGRLSRLHRMVDRLHRIGLHIDVNDVLQIAGDAAPGRPHVALELQRAGLVKDTREAFERYLGIGRPAYAERYKLTPCEAVRAIGTAGGVAVLAHPGLTGRLSLIDDLLECGLKGVEVYHPDHDECMVATLLTVASRHDLIVTGGSDYHGPEYQHSGYLGQIRVPYQAIERLKTEARSLSTSSRK